MGINLREWKAKVASRRKRRKKRKRDPGDRDTLAWLPLVLATQPQAPGIRVHCFRPGD